jgi:ribosomal protein S18 acetylase RimI-like enzyme
MGCPGSMIRRALVDDVPAIAAIHVAASHMAYRGLMPDAHLARYSVERRVRDWRRFLAAPGSDVFVDAEDGRMTGWINVGTSRDGDALPRTAELWAIYVDPPCWSRGVGQRLWEHGRAHLAVQGYQRVTLWVLEGNARAIRFYRRLGFAPDPGGRQTRDRSGRSLVELRYRLELPPS